MSDVILEEKVVHCAECTWPWHLRAGETPPGQSFWGQLNYGWCHSFCERPIAKIDFDVIYENAHGRWKHLGFHRLKYNHLVSRAIKENSSQLKDQALRIAGVTKPE